MLFLANIQGLHQSCGYADFIDKYLQIPAYGIQPPAISNSSADENCSTIATMVTHAEIKISPFFDQLQICSMCPLLYDPLGSPTTILYLQSGSTVYFDRSDVKAAMQAPQNVEWNECTAGVFADHSAHGS